MQTIALRLGLRTGSEVQLALCDEANGSAGRTITKMVLWACLVSHNASTEMRAVLDYNVFRNNIVELHPWKTECGRSSI